MLHKTKLLQCLHASHTVSLCFVVMPFELLSHALAPECLTVTGLDEIDHAMPSSSLMFLPGRFFDDTCNLHIRKGTDLSGPHAG